MLLADILARSQQAAVEAAKGTSYINTAGQLVLAPTTATLAAWTDAQVKAIIGQTIAPPATGWRMSNNSLSARVDTVQAAVNALPQQLADLHDGLLTAMQTLLATQASQFTTALTTQAQAFTAQLAQARTDLHTEILGSAGPLLDTIHQIQALQLSDEAGETAVHNQLFALLGAQSTQLTQLLATTGTLTTNQQAAAQSLGQLQGTVGGHTTDIASLKVVDASLRSDLTSASAKLDTTTATANGAQATAATLTTTVATLTTTVAGKALASDLVATNANLATLTSTVTNATTGLSATYTLAANALPLAGGTMTGALNVLVPTAATNPLPYSSLPLSATVPQSLPLIALGAAFSFTVPLAGAAVGQVVALNVPPALASSLSFYAAAVTAAGTVTVTLKAGVQIAAGTQTFYLRVLR